MDEFKKLSPLFEEDIREAILPETCVKNRNSLGGTSNVQVEAQFTLADDLVAKEKKETDTLAEKQINVH